MGMLKSVVNLARESIGFSLIFLIVSFFMGAIRPTILPFMNGITTSFYDLVILVFIGVGIISLLITAFGGLRQPTRATRGMSIPSPMRTEMTREEF